MIARIAISFALVALTGPAAALSPLPPCDGLTESGMVVTYAVPFAHDQSGFVAEGYQASATEPEGRPARLNGFDGMRIVECSSGRFVTILHEHDSYEVSKVLSATEFLRDAVRAEKRLKYNAVLRAAKAVYTGKITQFRETEETCGCNVFFPELRPKSLTEYSGDY